MNQRSSNLRVQIERFLPIGKYLFYLCIFGFMILVSLKVYREWNSIQWGEIQLRYHWLIIYVILAVISQLPVGLVWKICLAMYDADITYINSLKICLKSQLGKYIPGKVGLILTKVIESSKYNIPKKKAILASTFQIGVQLYSLSIISILSIGFVFREFFEFHIWHYLLVGTVLLAGALILRPENFIFIINKLFHVIGLDPFDGSLNNTSLWKIVLINISTITIGGIANFFLVKTVYIIDYNYMLYIICIGNLAFLLGLISIFAPSGIGVRESVWIYALSLIIPAPIALIVAFLLRTGALVIELLLILWAYIAKNGTRQ